MQRREALRFLGAAALAPLLTPLSAQERFALGRRLHQQLAAGVSGRALAASQLAQVRALADTLLPRTDTPGALDVGAPEFLDLLLAEWYSDEDRQQLLAGLDALDERCRTTQGKPLADLDGEGRARFLTSLETVSAESGPPEAAYVRIRGQLIFGFLTSQPIVTLTRTTPIIPGRFDGCVPLRGAQ